MPTIVDFPTIVQEALTAFGGVFDTEAARRYFAEYLTGLIVAENKTVSGINREFALTTDQSCLNRWLTEVEWDVTALNDRRLAWLQQAPQTRYSGRGVIAIDNTLVTHERKLIEDVGWFWDHADQRHVIAHDYIISNYVCPSAYSGDSCHAIRCKAGSWPIYVNAEEVSQFEWIREPTLPR